MAEKTIELLSPAGDMERLRMSLAYEADAVYLAGPDFGMRSFAGNFTPEELRRGRGAVPQPGVAVHVTCNTMPRNDEGGPPAGVAGVPPGGRGGRRHPGRRGGALPC